MEVEEKQKLIASSDKIVIISDKSGKCKCVCCLQRTCFCLHRVVEREMEETFLNIYDSSFDQIT